MKKFLFTLAALLAVGSMSADNYMYIDQPEVTPDQYGQEIEVPVMAHFDNLVSSWQIDLGCYDENGNFLANQLPAGVEIVYYEKSTGMTISYLNQRGRTVTATASLGDGENMTRFISMTSATDKEYAEIDGNLVECGAIKWQPGDYEMFILYVVYSDNYDGSPIVFKTTPSCGSDPRGNTAPKGETFLRPEWNDTPPTPVVAPEPTFDWSAESFTMEAVCENHTVVLMIGDDEVSNPYTVTQTYEEQTITFKAYTVAGAGETENSATVEMTVTVPAKALTPSNKPVITVTPGENVYTVEATGTGTVVLYLDNGAKALVEVGNPYEIARPAYGEADLTLNFKASNLDSDPEIQYDLAWAEKEVVVPAKDPVYYQTPDPEITVTVDEENEVVTITATGEGTVTLKVTGAEGTVDETSGQGTCSVEIPFGDEVDYVNAYATATAPGDFVYPGDATENMIEIPAKAVQPQEKTGDPYYYQAPGDKCYTVTLEPNANDPESVIYVSIDGGEYQVYNGPIVITDFGTHTVEAYAVAPGKAESNHVGGTFTIDENTQPDPTAVNELNGEKAVAGVRYFNMAGQEMQEANGVTIVVTTYTDGTTSAVKVIK